MLIPVLKMTCVPLKLEVIKAAKFKSLILNYLKEIFSTKCCCLFFDPKIMLVIYLSKDPEMCTKMPL